MVVSPSEMIAIGDVNRGTGFSPYADQRFGPGVSDIHSRGANIVFCDAHVEYGKQRKWVLASEVVRRGWNTDHEPHPETWSTNAPGF